VRPERPGDFDRAHHGGDPTANSAIDDWSPEAESKFEHHKWALALELQAIQRLIISRQATELSWFLWQIIAVDRRRAKAARAGHARRRLRTIRAYEYQDAATLLADFWEAVDAVLRERGVIP
jgi:hypothetical protein